MAARAVIFNGVVIKCAVDDIASLIAGHRPGWDPSTASLNSDESWCPALPHAAVPGPLVAWLLNEWLPADDAVIDDPLWARNCTSVTFRGDVVTDDLLGSFAALEPPMLRCVTVDSMNVTAGGVTSLCRMATIEELRVVGIDHRVHLPSLTSAVASLRRLRRLALLQRDLGAADLAVATANACPSLLAVELSIVRDVSLEQLAAAPSLTELDIAPSLHQNGTRGMDALVTMPGLKALALQGTKFAPVLPRLTELRTLQLDIAHFDRAIIEPLAQCPVLGSLTVIAQRCDPTVGSAFSALPCRSLMLRCNDAFTDDVIISIVPGPPLRKLELQRTSCTMAALRHLATLLSVRQVVVWSSRFDDADLLGPVLGPNSPVMTLRRYDTW